LAAIKQGRRAGSKVKLTPAARKLYPDLANRVGTIVKSEILTQGHGLARGAYHSYRISYFVRFEGMNRNYFIGSDNLMKA
jgi:hypothetical protein